MLCHKENFHKKMVKKLDISNKMLASKQASKYILITITIGSPTLTHKSLYGVSESTHYARTFCLHN